jgi:hypothetical protein
MRKHVDKGNSEAQIMLGNEYLTGGAGLRQDSKRAIELFALAAAQGHANAQTILGSCYTQGRGVEIDLKAAAQWFRRAGDQGYPQAQSNLGAMFYSGQGVAQSYVEAVKWSRLAAAQGDPDALFNLGSCHTMGHGEGPRRGAALCKRAAAQGHAGAPAQAERIAYYLAATRPGPPT